jgi:fermentation-respiration switch protein FrsA (DUF1100 family)
VGHAGAVDYVTSRGIPVERIGLLGFSLGAAVAILVAVKEPRIPAFVFPIVLVGRLFFGADFSKVRPIKKIAKIAQPIFFIHGERDHVISSQETEELYRLSNNREDRLWIVPGVGHITAYARHPQEYSAKVASFFQRHIK